MQITSTSQQASPQNLTCGAIYAPTAMHAKRPTAPNTIPSLNRQAKHHNEGDTKAKAQEAEHGERAPQELVGGCGKLSKRAYIYSLCKVYVWVKTAFQQSDPYKNQVSYPNRILMNDVHAGIEFQN